jgi:hypothetical protein
MQFLKRLDWRRFSRGCFIALAITMAAAALPAADKGAASAGGDEVSADRIARLIEQLGSNDFSAREKAQSELAQAGLEAYDALHAAQSHRDPEVALRARYLVRSMTGSVRWFADSDSPKVVAILKEYGDLPEGEKSNRIDRLAALEDRLGIVPLIRLARFETSDALAKYAALQILELSPPESKAAKDDLVKTIGNIVGNSKRTAAVWLRLYAHTLTEPEATLAEWDQATQAEQALFEKNPDRSKLEVVRDFYRFQVDLLHRLNRDKEADDVVRRTFAIVDGTTEQLQEAVDWLVHRESWALALELMQKFDTAVQENARLLYRLAAIHDSLNQPADAEKVADKALALKPETASEHLLLAKELEDVPRLARWAEAEYRQAIVSAMPGSFQDFSARFKLSELLHDHLQELAAAEMMRPIVELMQKDENSKDTWYRITAGLPAEAASARMNFFFACHFRDLGDHAKEKEHLKLAGDAYFKDADVLIAMYRLPNADDAWKVTTKEKIEAVTTEFQGEVDDARNAVEGADDERSKSDAQWAYAHECNQYAWLVGNTFGDYEKALKLAQEAVKISQLLPQMKPHQAGFLDTLGRAYYGTGNYAGAVKHQAMAVKLNPVSGQIRRQYDFFVKEAKQHGVELPAGDVPPPPQRKPEAQARGPGAAPLSDPAKPAQAAPAATPEPRQP